MQLVVFTVLHLLCCGLLLLVVFGVSLPVLRSLQATIAIVIFLIVVIGAAWYWKWKCPACPIEEKPDEPQDRADGGNEGLR